MFTLDKNIQNKIRDFNELSKTYFHGASSIEETDFPLFVLEERSLEFQQLISVYNQAVNFYFYSYFKKILPQEQLSQNSFSGFLNVFEVETNSSILRVLNKNRGRKFPGFSVNSTLSSNLLQVWALFPPNSIKTVLTKRIEDNYSVLEEKIKKFSALKQTNTSFDKNQKEEILLDYRFFLLFIVKTIFGRQSLFQTLTNLEKFSFLNVILFDIVVGIDFKIAEFLKLFSQYLVLCKVHLRNYIL